MIVFVSHYYIHGFGCLGSFCFLVDCRKIGAGSGSFRDAGEEGGGLVPGRVCWV
jgi:hypothetical protein